LSGNYEESAKKELGSDYPQLSNNETDTPLAIWYEQNQDDVLEFEKQMRRKVHYVIKPEYLWRSVAELARKQHNVYETLALGDLSNNCAKFFISLSVIPAQFFGI
jgi:type I restriction enzyme M protein